MEKNLKCLLLKDNNVILISEIEEQSAELGEPDCKLINPCRYNTDGSIERWPQITDQKEILIHSDSILTIVDPTKELIENYTKVISS